MIHVTIWMNFKCLMRSEEVRLKSYILYDSICITLWERQNYRDQNYISDYQGPVCSKSWLQRGKTGRWQNCSISSLWWQLQSVWVCQNLQNRTLKWVHFTVHTLYLIFLILIKNYAAYNYSRITTSIKSKSLHISSQNTIQINMKNKQNHTTPIFSIT